MDWASDVRRYAPDACDQAIAGIVRHCGLGLGNPMQAVVCLTDRREMDEVREKFLRGTLGLRLGDAELDGVMSAVAARFPGGRANRVTAYYLLARKFRALDLFRGGTRRMGAIGATDGMKKREFAPVRRAHDVEADRQATLARTAKVANSGNDVALGRTGVEGRQVVWLMVPVFGLALAVKLIAGHAEAPSGGSAGAWSRDEVPTASAPLTQSLGAAIGIGTPAATANGDSLASGAGGDRISSTLREGLPLTTVRFAPNDTQPGQALAASAIALQRYLGAHPGDRLVVTAFAAPDGSTSGSNGHIAIARARAVRDTLVRAGIDAGLITLARPTPGSAQTQNHAVEIAVHS